MPMRLPFASGRLEGVKKNTAGTLCTGTEYELGRKEDKAHVSIK